MFPNLDITGLFLFKLEQAKVRGTMETDPRNTSISDIVSFIPSPFVVANENKATTTTDRLRNYICTLFRMQQLALRNDSKAEHGIFEQFHPRKGVAKNF